MNKNRSLSDIEANAHFTCGSCGYNWSERISVKEILEVNGSIKRNCPKCGTGGGFVIDTAGISALIANSSTTIMNLKFHPIINRIEETEKKNLL